MLRAAVSSPLLHLLPVVAGFAVVSLASNNIGRFFSRYRLPLITGFLVTGVLAGPFSLGLIPGGAPAKLAFIDHISLAVIAFAAGSELYLKEMRSQLKAIAWNSAASVAMTFRLGALAVFLLTDAVPFLAPLPTAGRIGASLLAGAILVARSPSSAIAIIDELRARGPFTHTALGVTVVVDVAVIILFSVCFALAQGLASERGFDLLSTGLLVVELALSVGVACAVGHCLHLALSALPWAALKNAVVLVAGYGVFHGAELLRDGVREHWGLPVHLEPLLVCLIAAFYVTNFTPSREAMARVLHAVTPAVFVAFFTLVGASLELDVIATTWPIALALFTIRLGSIVLGSLVGGTLARQPGKHIRIGWMPYVTQAGVALGLAKGVGVAFPEWGPSFATTMIALIVLNQVVGPPFFKWAIYIAGEQRVRASAAEFEGTRTALLVGVEGHSLALARVLRSAGWHIKLACIDTTDVQQVGDQDVWIHPLPRIDAATLAELGGDRADAIVCLLPDDMNYDVCEIAYENFGTRLLVARLADRRLMERFRKLGVMVIDPSSAMVSLLERSVRSPATTSILLGMEEGVDLVDVEVGNPDVAGLDVRELRMPLDVALLCVYRDGEVVASSGSVVLRVGDLVTLSGPHEAVEKATSRLE